MTAETEKPEGLQARAAAIIAELQSIDVPNVVLKQITLAGKAFALLREIASAPPQPCAPCDYVLVPRKPTEDMLHAAMAVSPLEVENGVTGHSYYPLHMYKAMIGAAPSPTAGHAATAGVITAERPAAEAVALGDLISVVCDARNKWREGLDVDRVIANELMLRFTMRPLLYCEHCGSTDGQGCGSCPPRDSGKPVFRGPNEKDAHRLAHEYVKWLPLPVTMDIPILLHALNSIGARIPDEEKS